MSDTPRTDAAAREVSITCDDSCCEIYVKVDGKPYYGELVTEDFAKQLETENAQLREELRTTSAELDRKLSQELSTVMDLVDAEERAERAEAELAEREKDLECLIQMTTIAEMKRVEALTVEQRRAANPTMDIQ